MHRESPFLFINNLTFHNFKRLQRSDISMANLMILVGPNGGGKSSIISAFDFFTTFFNAKYNSIAEFENKFKTFNFIDFYSRNPDGEKTFSIGFQINSNDKIFKEKAFQISFNFYNYERGIQLESVKLIFYNMFSFNIILKENESVLLDMDPNSLSFDYLKSDLVDEYSGDGILVDTPGPPHEDMYKRIKVNVEDSKESKNITDVIAYSLGIILPETLEKLKSNFFYGVFAEDREEFYNDLANWISKASFKEGINYYSDIILDSIDYLEDIYFYFIEGLRVISETFINISIIDDVRKTPSEFYFFKGGTFSEDYYGILKFMIEKESSQKKQKIFKKMLEALCYFSIADDFKLELIAHLDNGTKIFELNLFDQGRKFNIKNLSSGGQQLLPIIFQLLINETSIFAIKQPELHLHPNLQSYLANMISDYHCNQKSLMTVIETHSEHLIKKIQILVSQKIMESKFILIGYIDKDESDILRSNIKEIFLNANGMFSEEWPKGFFDEAADLSFELLKSISQNHNLIEKEK